MELMPGFWAPKPSQFWNLLLSPLRHYYLHRFYGISSVVLSGAENLTSGIGAGDGVLIAPNHSHDSDPHVMMDVGKQLGRQLYFMAAWQVFLAHRGIDGFVMQRFGAFSVDREGCDRRAMRQATVSVRRKQNSPGLARDLIGRQEALVAAQRTDRVGSAWIDHTGKGAREAGPDLRVRVVA